ncbi:MAG: hypothetical protein K0S24_2221 [Sphingobacterium sp.]|jgi:chromate transport protein ChrA|nr:hypothetical protein [Sphingobacterium sp.]
MRWSYVFKHWASTILLTSILLPIFTGFARHKIFDELWLFPYILVGGTLFSLPTLFIYIITFHILNHYKVEIKWIKTILISITLIGIYLTSYLLNNGINLEFVLTYSAIAIVSGVLFQVERK